MFQVVTVIAEMMEHAGASKIKAEFSLDFRPLHQEDDLNTFSVKYSQKLNQHLISAHHS